MKVGVALGGGGVRGMAHVVALETIDELGITPTAVTGTSMGSIVGALYAAGMSGQEIRGRLDHLVIKQGEGLRDIYRKKEHLIKWVKAFRPAVGGKGLVKADGLMQYLLDALQSAAENVRCDDCHRCRRHQGSRSDQAPLGPGCRAQHVRHAGGQRDRSHA